MKLESLKLEKFKDESLKRDHMAFINGGLAGTATPGGNICSPHGPAGHWMNFDYGYDALRTDANGASYISYHNRSNLRDICEQPSGSN